MSQLTQEEAERLVYFIEYYRIEDEPGALVKSATAKLRAQTNPDQAPSDSGELNKLMDELEGKLTDLISANPQAIAAAKADAFASRRSVLDLFERLQNRIAELERSTSGA